MVEGIHMMLNNTKATTTKHNILSQIITLIMVGKKINLSTPICRSRQVLDHVHLFTRLFNAHRLVIDYDNQDESLR